jgi:hypothetical protein
MEATERTARISGQVERKPKTMGGRGTPAGITVKVTKPVVWKLSRKCRVTVLMEISSAKLATLETEAMKAAAGVGAPS